MADPDDEFLRPHRPLGARLVGATAAVTAWTSAMLYAIARSQVMSHVHTAISLAAVVCIVGPIVATVQFIVAPDTLTLPRATICFAAFIVGIGLAIAQHALYRRWKNQLH